MWVIQTYLYLSKFSELYLAKPWTANLAKKVTTKSEEWALFIQQLTPTESSVEEVELLWEQLPSVHINHQSRSETKWNICSIARSYLVHSDMVLQRILDDFKGVKKLNL